MLPEQETGCLIQTGLIRFTQCPLETVARPDAPPFSFGPEPRQCTDQRNVSGSPLGSVTTSRKDRGARTCPKLVSRAPEGVASWRTIRRP